MSAHLFCLHLKNSWPLPRHNQNYTNCGKYYRYGGRLLKACTYIYMNHELQTTVSTKIQSYLLLSLVPQIALFSSLEEKNHPNSQETDVSLSCICCRCTDRALRKRTCNASTSISWSCKRVRARSSCSGYKSLHIPYVFLQRDICYICVLY